MDILKTIFITAIFLLFFFALELFKRRYGIRAEFTRKFAHVLTGFGAILTSFVLGKWSFILITFFFFLVFFGTYKKKVFQAINLDKQKTYGEIFYPLGLISLAILLYSQRTLFIIGILLLAIPDAVSWLIGYRFKKKGKSLLGSLGYFLTTAVILLTFSFRFDQVILLSLILTFTEFLMPLGFDNLVVPLVYGAIVSFLTAI